MQRVWGAATSSLDEGVGEEQHQGDHEAVDRQRLHEGQRQQQHATEVVRHLRLPADAVDAAARSDALADAGADGREPDGEARAHRGERRDPDAACAAAGVRSAAALSAPGRAPAPGAADETGAGARWGAATKALPTEASSTAPTKSAAPVSTREREAAISLREFWKGLRCRCCGSADDGL